MTDHTENPDYELDDVLVLESPAQFKAIGHPARQAIFGLLLERAATTSQLAASLNLPKGTVGSHLDVLREAGLVRVVRTRQVRALTEKYYGRVARNLEMRRAPEGRSAAEVVLQRVAGESLPGGEADHFVLVHARVTQEDAGRFLARLEALADEFKEVGRSEGPVYGLVAGLYLTPWPELPTEEEPGEHH
jgi:DNA-binding transcriptional ArsR family regulator